jgi:catalase
MLRCADFRPDESSGSSVYGARILTDVRGARFFVRAILSSMRDRSVTAPDELRETASAAESLPPAIPPRSAAGGGDPDLVPHATDTSKSAVASAVDAYVAPRDHNPDTPFEYGEESARDPQAGSTLAEPAPELAASTSSEVNATDKSGLPPSLGEAMSGSLSLKRVDATGRPLTTNQGVQIADNQHSLKAGLRGPTLLEDFILREKITHFDHERIPERIVHARGSGAHGIFESYGDFSHLTKAAPFAEAGKVTPVFTRFSTVAGERGSTDTARDARGFAVKFYTDDGVWDLVGNNIPVFFIQDAMKFPDFVHAVKPEPHNGIPQAASAHDTFWDFVSLMPESTHMLMWVMSDRAIPRSYRMMQGFGVNTYRLIAADGTVQFVKFHWTPLLGTHSLVWDEAVKLSGADPDFHRRDLWDAIEGGSYPQYELGLQVFTEEQAETFSFDVLDATKLVPEELVPVTPVGRMTLNRNPDNFFAETEQVAFCTAHVVPGIDFSNDPLLHGRIHSYHDTQLTRLGGPNFHEIPINASIAPVHNNQRDGMHRQAIHHGRVAYEPNSLGGGCPFQAGRAGFSSFPEPIEASKLRGKPEKFAEHYVQARLFYESQTPVEQQHIAAAFRFELSKVTVPSIRRRMVAGLVNVSTTLASEVASGLGMEVPDALPLASDAAVSPEVTHSPALSLTARPGDGSIVSRKIAMLVANGIDAESVRIAQQVLAGYGAVTRLVGIRLGAVRATDGTSLDVDLTMENTPSAAFDGIILPAGDDAVTELMRDPHTGDYVRDQWRHAKTILAPAAASGILAAFGIALTDAGEPAADGLVRTSGGISVEAVETFATELAEHRHFSREGVASLR